MTSDDENIAYSSRNADKFVVRLPDGMREKIAEIAKRYRRSMNSEIVNRLESSLDNTPPTNTLSPITSTNIFDESDIEAVMLTLFRDLSDDKQKALLQLMRSLVV